MEGLRITGTRSSARATPVRDLQETDPVLQKGYRGLISPVEDGARRPPVRAAFSARSRHRKVSDPAGQRSADHRRTDSEARRPP